MALGGVAQRGPELRFYIEHPRRICATESAEAQALLVTERCGVDIRVVVPRRVRATCSTSAPSASERAG
jgi:hypothetical protein